MGLNIHVCVCVFVNNNKEEVINPKDWETILQLHRVKCTYCISYSIPRYIFKKTNTHVLRTLLKSNKFCDIYERESVFMLEPPFASEVTNIKEMKQGSPSKILQAF